MRYTKVGTSMVGLALMGLVSGCGAIPLAPATVTATLTTDDLDRQQYPPNGDATVVSCTMAAGYVQASGTVVNPTKHPYNYTITVDFLTGAGALAGEVFAVPLPVLKAGMSTTWTASSPALVTGTLKCLASSVIRTTPLK